MRKAPIVDIPEDASQNDKEVLEKVNEMTPFDYQFIGNSPADNYYIEDTELRELAKRRVTTLYRQEEYSCGQL